MLFCQSGRAQIPPRFPRRSSRAVPEALFGRLGAADADVFEAVTDRLLKRGFSIEKRIDSVKKRRNCFATIQDVIKLIVNGQSKDLSILYF